MKTIRNVFLLIGTSFIFGAILQYKTREIRFLVKAFDQLQEGGERYASETIRLESGEDVSFIMEHWCCTGAGFAAVAIRTSDGREFESRKNYCGSEVLHGEILGWQCTDLESLRRKLVADGYTERQTEQVHAARPFTRALRKTSKVVRKFSGGSERAVRVKRG